MVVVRIDREDGLLDARGGGLGASVCNSNRWSLWWSGGLSKADRFYMINDTLPTNCKPRDFFDPSQCPSVALIDGHRCGYNTSSTTDWFPSIHSETGLKSVSGQICIQIAGNPELTRTLFSRVVMQHKDVVASST